MVFSARNKETKVRYAIKVTDKRADNKSYEPQGLPGDVSPALTQSSEAQIIESEGMTQRSLYAKRVSETRTSLQYIRSGHPNVCNLEAWAEFEILAYEHFMFVMELCDLGTLQRLVRGFQHANEYIPEGFIVSSTPSLSFQATYQLTNLNS